MKTVTLPIEEYEDLVKDRKDKNRLMEEIEANADKRGYFVRYITQCWRKCDKYGWEVDYKMIQEKNTIKIFSKDEVLADAQKEIDRLTKVSEELSKTVDVLMDENNNLRNRGFFARLFNKDD